MSFRQPEEVEADRASLLKYLKAWRSMPEMMDYLGASRATVDRRLNELLDDQLITFREVKTVGKRGLRLEWRRA